MSLKKLTTKKKRAILVHWNKEELSPKLKLLRSLGFTVTAEHGEGAVAFSALRNNLPAVVVIYLSRLPSHGSHFAGALRETKSTKEVPIVFVDGDPAKVAAIKAKIPDALYTTEQELPEILKNYS